MHKLLLILLASTSFALSAGAFAQTATPTQRNVQPTAQATPSGANPDKTAAPEQSKANKKSKKKKLKKKKGPQRQSKAITT